MDLVDQIEEVRASNNRSWMDLMRLALELDPERAKQIISDIREHDRQILKLLDELASS